MPTTTLDYITAEDGVSDTIDLSQRLNTVTDGIYVNDIDIKWRGNETRRENTFTERDTNVNTDSSTAEITTETITETQEYYTFALNTNRDTFTATIEDSKTITRQGTGVEFTSFPSSPGSEYSVSSSRLTTNGSADPGADVSVNINGSAIANFETRQSTGRFYYSNSGGFNPGDSVSVLVTDSSSVSTTASMTFRKPSVKNTGRATATYPPVPSGYEFDHHQYIGTDYRNYIYQNLSGTTVESRAFADEDGESVSLVLRTAGRDLRTKTNTRTVTRTDNLRAKTTFPPVPDGYDFTKHEVRGDTDNRYIYDNRVGETVQSDKAQSDGETVTIDAVTHGINYYTVVSYDQTEYAEITGDIDASLTTTLDDSNTTSTQNVDAHQSGIIDTLDVNYNIGNSEYADYQLTIDWQYPYARPQHGSLALKDAGQWYLTAIDDPNSPALKHNHIRLYDNQTDTWGAIDVAPVDDRRTLESYRFYDHQTDQWFAPRYYETRQP